MMSDDQVKDFIEMVNQNPKEVLSALIGDPNLRDSVNKLVTMCDMGQDLDTLHTFEEITFVKERINYLKTAEMSSEQNYNQIDGIINNEPPRTIGGYAVTDSHIVGNDEFAFGENEKAPSPYGSWQRNIKNDEERSDGENWFWGHYFGEKEKAVTDFKERVKDALEEVAIKSPSVTTKLKAFQELESQNKTTIHKNKNIER